MSPLRRAVQTAEIVWGGRPSPVCQLASLREIDLYSFQARPAASMYALVFVCEAICFQLCCASLCVVYTEWPHLLRVACAQDADKTVLLLLALAHMPCAT